MHPFPTFPYRLEYQDGNDTRICHFECEEHRTKHIQRYKLRKGKYFIDNALPKDPIIPSLMFLGVIFCTLCVIVLGYIHGNMHLLTTLKNAANP